MPTSALFRLSSDGGATFLGSGVSFADAQALAYAASGAYAIVGALDSTSGVDSAVWSISSADDEHLASLPAVTNNPDKTCSLSVPKTGGAWLLQVVVNSGVSPTTGAADPALTRRLAIKVLTEGGYQLVAVGETDEAGTGGWTKAHNDLARALDALGGGSTVVYKPGGVASGNVYTTWATAVAAAQEIDGVVNVYIDASLGTPEFTGVVDLERRIKIVAYGASLPINATVASGAQLQNASYFEGIAFTGNLGSSLFTVSDGSPQDITFAKCSRTETADSADLIALATGANKVTFSAGSQFTSSSRAAMTLASGKNVTATVDATSQVNANVIAGSAGALTLRLQAGAVAPAQASFSGTLDQQQAAAQFFRAQGVAGTQSLDSTTWTTIGVVHLDPSALPASGGSTRTYKLHGELEVVEASPGTVQAEVRLLDASLTSLGSVSSTLSGATTFPEHKSATLTAGGSNGQVRPTATTYLVQLRRSGGSSGDFALCHNAYLEASWS